MRLTAIYAIIAALVPAAFGEAGAGKGGQQRTLRAEMSSDDVRLTVSLPAQSAVGKGIPITITFGNNGDPIMFWSYGDLATIEVRSGDGKLAGKKEPGNENVYMCTSWLKSGKSMDFSCDLANRYELKPGRYLLTVTRTFNEQSPDKWGYLVVKDLPFYVGEVRNPFLEP